MATAAATRTNWWNGGRSPFNVEYGKLMMWYFLISDAFTFGALLISYGTIRFSQNYWANPNEVFNAFPGAGHTNLPLAFVSLMTFILIMSSVTMVLAVHEGHHNNKKGVIKWLAWTIVGGIAFLSCQAWEWTHLITGEHAVLVDGHLSVMGQTVTHNPWGPHVSAAQVAAALPGTPHDVLVQLAHGANHTMSHEQLEAMQSPQLMDMVNKAVSAGEMHVQEPGPKAYGGYFYAITGFHGFHVTSGVIINIIMLLMTVNGVFDKRGHYLMIEKAGLYWHFVDLVWVFVFLCFYLI
ncbi:cytochrome c oxidase subunit 3 [Flavisolibacter ginsenosidimutans]|uniref:Cytochrome c oxidase subunit III n=1 Tax=Flavisolibacter ginsenosidimutans TaxID=661481 RepID=A0A5B8UL09_9BACT|nr:cytochrome c oxidase subunit 3 [Flavisolibacter ginsenosidimutans]QEC57374.1 cytochrome c oxidase subunit III [Flavisolibacter ginsenosidimutans]